MSNEQIQSGLSRRQLEMELERVERSRDRSGKLKSTILWMLIVMALAVAASVIWFPIMWIEHDAAETGEAGQLIVAMRTQTVNLEDAVVCRMGEKAGIYRVFAVKNGEIVVTDLTGEITQNILWDEIIGKAVFQIWPFPPEIYP